MFILLVGLTWVSVKSNQVSKKFNNNLTASSSHGQYPRLEMTEVWSVSLEVTAAAIWLLRWAGRRSLRSSIWREAHGHQPWHPALGNSCTDPPAGNAHDLWFMSAGGLGQNLWGQVLTQRNVMTHIPLLSQGLRAHRHTTHTGHYAGTLGWSCNNLPSQFAIVQLTTNQGNSDPGPFNWLMNLRLPGC